MKRLALTTVFFCLGVVVIIGLGGVHLSRFVRYVPTNVFHPPSSESPFVPAIFPDTGSVVHQVVIPGLFYIHNEPDTEPQLQVGIGGFDSHGYRNAQSFTIEKLELAGASGEMVLLVPPSHPVTYAIDPIEQGRKRTSLGRCSGEQFTIRVQGHAIMRTGAKVMFSESQVWTRKLNTSLKLGIFLSE